MVDLLPPGPKLYAANRRLLAERLGWPPGAVQVCQMIDWQFPGWHSDYRHANTWIGRPAGWFAFHPDHLPMEHLYGATPQALRLAIKAHKFPAPVRWQPVF